ncbi:MAG: MFS transporter [Caldilineaceae bacterium]|nr:MFS transporter [Caldilineaceae bacterium]
MANTVSKSTDRPSRFIDWSSPQTQILIGLMAPSIMVGMDHHMFGVALPTLRAAFALDADTTAWASMGYSLPFMALMPLYGRLGDGLGKRRLILLGTLLFLIGSSLVVTATSFPVYIIGRAIQGTGTAGFVPLSIAIIAQWFGPDERGKVMGAWNSIIPLTGLTVPYFGGLLVDAFGWRAIYPPIMIAGVIALFVVRRNIPTLGARTVDPTFLRRFDWPGVALLSGGLVALLFYTSSRPITGVDGLRDWRLLLLCIIFFAGLLFWERRRQQPYVNLQLFRNRTFTAVCVAAGLRMTLMSSISFILPLYLTDIHALSASAVGIALALQAGTLFLISRAGGQMADRWGSRRPILFSMVGLIAIMVTFAVVPTSTPVWVLYLLSAAHGLIIGISLAPLHRSSMQGIAPEQTGGAAGLYSMIRFAGQILGVAVAGVMLQQGLAGAGTAIAAYQFVFWLYVGVAVVATIASWGVRE